MNLAAIWTGAWSDLLVMFRMSRQWTGAVPLQQAYYSLNNEHQALSLAMTWAADSRQTAAPASRGARRLPQASPHAQRRRADSCRGADRAEHGEASPVHACRRNPADGARNRRAKSTRWTSSGPIS